MARPLTILFFVVITFTTTLVFSGNTAAQPAKGLTYAEQKAAFLSGGLSCKLGEGSWELASGELRCMECPKVWEDGLARMPQGCVSFSSGVLVKRQKYVEREGDIAVLKKKLETAETQLNMYKERVAKLEEQVRFCRVEKVVEERGDTSWTWAFPIGFAAGASLLLLRN